MNDTITWIPASELDGWKEIQKKMNDREAAFLWGTFKPSPPKGDDNVKLAWVIIKGYRTMLGVDNKTMKGYAMNENTPTWKHPLEPISYDTFERWCTTFDV